MRKQPVITTANFGPVVKTWSFERFMATFAPLYPVTALREIAAELGLKPVKKLKKHTP